MAIDGILENLLLTFPTGGHMCWPYKAADWFDGIATAIGEMPWSLSMGNRSALCFSLKCNYMHSNILIYFLQVNEGTKFWLIIDAIFMIRVSKMA